MLEVALTKYKILTPPESQKSVQEDLLSKLEDLNDHYEDMHAKRGRLSDYEG